MTLCCGCIFPDTFTLSGLALDACDRKIKTYAMKTPILSLHRQALSSHSEPTFFLDHLSTLFTAQQSHHWPRWLLEIQLLDPNERRAKDSLALPWRVPSKKFHLGISMKFPCNIVTWKPLL
jgi:hypothetical protein